MPRDYYTKSSTDYLRIRSARIRKKPFYKIHRCSSCVVYNVDYNIDRSISDKYTKYLRNKRFCELATNLEKLNRTIRQYN